MVFTSYMDIALEEARAAAERGEVPVGAVIVRDGEILARAGNRTREWNDPTAHAEIVALRAACDALGTDRIPGAELWVTLEPCPMCAAAIANARIEKLVFGADDPKSGGVKYGARIFDRAQCHHAPEIIEGVGGAEAASLLKDFFSRRRA